MSSSNSVSVRYIKESTYGVTPAAVKASKVIQSLTYLADAEGENGNLINIAYTGGATAGSEVVTVVGKNISVQIETGVSTATEIKAAIDASVESSALLSVSISGAGADTQVIAGASFLTSGFGNFKTARFTSEKFSGTPGTTESQQIRTDRMSSGQIVTSLAVAGELSFELAKESPIDDFFASGMLNSWQTFSPVSVDLSLDVTAKTLTRATGSWPVTLKKGDIITLGAFTNSENNSPVMVTSLISPTVLGVIGAEDMITEIKAGTTFQQNDKLEIGTTQHSFSFEKVFEDLTTKAILYKGMLVSNISLNVGYGAIVNGSFTFSGNGYQDATIAGDFLTNGRTIDPAATTDSMNGSIDMPFLATSAIGALDRTAFGIQKVNLTLDNQYTTQNAIGEVAPFGYSAGTAKIGIELSAYLADNNWSILAKKLNQAAFEIGFMVKNAGGWYAFYLPAVQCSFDDPTSGGANQDVTLDMKGLAKVGNNGESALVIFRSL